MTIPSTSMHEPTTLGWVMGLTLAMSLSACAGRAERQEQPGGYRTVSAEPRRDTPSAQRANNQGLEHLDKGELEAAQRAFESALVADVEFGPAHNNLGKVFYRQRDWYKAAWEFEYASRLMPRHAEPRNNLGLVLEEAGELDRAVDQYRQAVSLDPKPIVYRANLARALVRRGERTDEVYRLLDEIIREDTRVDWVQWAKLKRAQSPP